MNQAPAPALAILTFGSPATTAGEAGKARRLRKQAA